MAIAQQQAGSTETVLYQSDKVKANPNVEGRRRTLGQRVDAFIEYPGSRKGNPGWWRVTEWLGAKADELMDHGSGRRR